MSAMRRALLLFALLLCALPPAAVAARGSFWLGPSFEGLPLTHDEPGFYVYGDCDIEPGSEGGCSPPLQVQNATSCERNPVGLDIAPSRLFKLRGGAIAATYEAGHLQMGSGRRAVTVFADSARQAIRAARALRRRFEEAPSARLAPPVYPAPVRREIKRVLVARRQHPTVNSIARATGLPRFAVRTRLRLGRLLGRDSFRQVPEPARPWSAVEQDRQAAFITQDSGERQAARDLGVSRAELRRMLRRVRGLAGRC
jgi:hypothetical protein